MVDQQDDTHNTGVGETTPVSPSHSASPTPARQGRKTSAPHQRRELPQYRVILHNDDVHEIPFVVQTVLRLTPLSRVRATLVTLHAHYHGAALVLITHKERAELYCAQFRSRGLTVSMEPDGE